VYLRVLTVREVPLRVLTVREVPLRVYMPPMVVPQGVYASHGGTSGWVSRVGTSQGGYPGLVPLRVEYLRLWEKRGLSAPVFGRNEAFLLPF